MIGTLLKAAAYSKAPRTTFTVLHPAKAVLFRKFRWDMRHAHAPRITALGAAALALPLGLWLGRRTNGRNGESHASLREEGPVRTELSGSDATGLGREDTAMAETVGLGGRSTRGGCIDRATPRV